MYINQCVKHINADRVQIFERKTGYEKRLPSEILDDCECLLFITICNYCYIFIYRFFADHFAVFGKNFAYVYNQTKTLILFSSFL